MEPIPKMSTKGRLLYAALVGSLLAYVALVGILLPAGSRVILPTSITFFLTAMVLGVGWLAVKREVKLGLPSSFDYRLLGAWYLSEVVFFLYISWLIATLAFGGFGTPEEIPLWAAASAIGLCLLMAGLGLGYRRRRAHRPTGPA